MVQVTVAARTIGMIPAGNKNEGFHLIEKDHGGFGAQTREVTTWCGLTGRVYVYDDFGSADICGECEHALLVRRRAERNWADPEWRSRLAKDVTDVVWPPPGTGGDPPPSAPRTAELLDRAGRPFRQDVR